MKQKLVVFWSRRDFRLLDNPALFEALKYARENNVKFAPVFIIDDGLVDPRTNVGFNRRLYLAKALANFAKQFPNFWIFCGKPVDIFKELLDIYDVQLYFNEDIEPYALKRDRSVVDLFNLSGVAKAFCFPDQLRIDKQVVSSTGNVYTVFTPFKKVVLNDFINAKYYLEADLNQVEFIQNISEGKNHLKMIETRVSENELRSQIENIVAKKDTNLHLGDFSIDLSNLQIPILLDSWYYTEEQALDKLDHFVSHDILEYKESRNSLALDTEEQSTSHLSLALKWGLISPTTIVRKLKNKYQTSILENENIESYISELLWREFYRYILYHFPFVLDLELQEKHQNKIRWAEKSIAIERFVAWVNGQTGYDLVDAGMNQLLKTGWMHNRMRMVVGSVLCKNFGVDWRWGQEYFRYTLLDHDEASNNGGWQWAASVGADPKPIRIFNPYLQADKFDQGAIYRNKWLPVDYSPKLIIDHQKARSEALSRYNLGPKD